MRAISYNTYGGPDELRLVDLPRPTPKPDQVLIRIHAASLNSWDWDMLRGSPFITRLIGGGIFKPGIPVLGADVAGVVEAVGDQITNWQPGDRVFGDLSGCAWGGFAEYSVAKQAELARIPDALSFEQAAALPQAGLLALQGLRDIGAMKAGDAVLINGAGGGVGTIGIQLARLTGTHVTTVDRADKLDCLRDLGVDDVIDYQTTDFTALGQRWDVILDAVAHHPIGHYRRALTKTGTFVFVGGNLRRALGMFLTAPLQRLRGARRLRILPLKPNRADLEHLAELVATGELDPVIGQTYPLEETPAAMAAIGAGDHFGKLVIDTTA